MSLIEAFARGFPCQRRSNGVKIEDYLKICRLKISVFGGREVEPIVIKLVGGVFL
jgi:hypothetical protein